MPNVRQNAVWPLFLDEGGVDVFERQHLHRVRSVRMYKAPLVLLKRTLVNRRVAAVLVERDVTYSNALVGVSASEDDLPLLAAFAAAAVSSLGMYWFFHTSSSWGVERDFIEVNEFKSLPVPEPTGTLVDRLLVVHRGARSGVPVNDAELDDLVFDLFKLSSADRDRVRRGVAEGPDRFAAGLSGSEPATPGELSVYRDTLAESISSLLPELRPTVSVGRDGSFGYARVVFRSGRPRTSDRLPVSDVLATGRVSTPQSSGLIAPLSGLYLDGNTVHMIKTLDRDRWSAEAAIDDVDRVVAMLTTGEVRA
jgi:hypothetical protein